MRLFGPRYRLQVADFRFEGLDIRFEAEHTNRRTPNSASIVVSNLTPRHRKQLQELDTVFVRLEVGWIDGIWELFRGDLRAVTSREIPDGGFETTISSGDGERVLLGSRVALSLSPGVSIDKAVREVVSSMGLTIEDSSVGLVSKSAWILNGARDLAEGLAIHGNGADVLDDLLGGVGLEWSVQAGRVRVLEVNVGTVPGEAVVLSPRSGLIGSPEPGTKGITLANCLIQPGIEPGRRIRIESEHASGAYRIERVRTSGDTGSAGGDWFQAMELRRLS